MNRNIKRNQPTSQTNRRAMLSSFRRADRYAALKDVTQASMVRESHSDETAFPYSERHLQCVWFDSSLRPPLLRSADGEEIIIEDAGHWNLEAGPDFLDAVLSIGAEHRKVCGDVEIHIRPGDWQDHGHLEDPAYSRVVAHVSYFPGSLPANALPTGAVQISLRDALRSNPTFSFECVDVTSYPYASLPAKPTPCGEILASRDPDEGAQLLESAGEERLRVKAARMAENIRERGEEQVFYEEIMCALGYKHNRIPFRQLAFAVPLLALQEEAGADPMKAYSLFLGVGGLLPAKTSMRWDDEARAFIRCLWDNWWKQQAKWDTRTLDHETWHLLGLRPQNHPVRRMAAASVLFTGKKSLLLAFNDLDVTSPKTWFRDAQALLTGTSGMEFWKRRLSFAGKPQDSEVELIGAGRVSAMLSNVVIPFLAATGVNIAPLLAHLPPEENNNLIRRTAYALFGRDHNPALYQTGLRQQGLLQIFHDFCLNNKTACRACRLADALSAK